jgi:hypothetical protein
MKRYEQKTMPLIPEDYRCYEHGVGVPIITINRTHLCAPCVEIALQRAGAREIQPVKPSEVDPTDRAKIWPKENFGDKVDPYLPEAPTTPGATTDDDLLSLALRYAETGNSESWSFSKKGILKLLRTIRQMHLDHWMMRPKMKDDEVIAWRCNSCADLNDSKHRCKTCGVFRREEKKPLGILEKFRNIGASVDEKIWLVEILDRSCKLSLINDAESESTTITIERTGANISRIEHRPTLETKNENSTKDPTR